MTGILVKSLIWLRFDWSSVHECCEQNVQESGETLCFKFALSTCALERAFPFLELKEEMLDVESEN